MKFYNALKNIRLLYVEDDSITSAELGEILSNRVEELFVAGDGEEGLLFYHEKKPDIILTDIMMPKLNGLDMTKEIRKRDKEIPIVVNSAFHDSKLFTQAIELNVSGYVLKPTVINDLLDRLEHIAQTILKERELGESKSYLKNILDAQPHIVLINDSKKILDANRAFFDFFTQYNTIDELLTMNICVGELFEPTTIEGFISRMEISNGWLERLAEHPNEFKCFLKKNEKLHIFMINTTITYLNGKKRYIVTLTDISEIYEVQKEVYKLSKVVEQIDDIVSLTDPMGNITYVNQAFCDHTGYTREEALGKTSRILKSGRNDEQFYHGLWETILDGGVFRGTVANKKKNGDLYYENKTITPLKDDKKSTIGFISSGKDITVEILMQQEMEKIATLDKLTGIYNRHKFEELLMLEIERSRRFSQPLSLLLIDIDHFKLVNDNYGHDIGDQVLRYLVKIIQDNIRKIDIFARWGGEEFLILSPSTNFENIQILAEKLRLAVADAEFPKVSHITISQGVAMFEANDTFIEVFKRVDQGLYYAKEHGRNQVGAIVQGNIKV